VTYLTPARQQLSALTLSRFFFSRSSLWHHNQARSGMRSWNQNLLCWNEGSH